MVLLVIGLVLRASRFDTTFLFPCCIAFCPSLTFMLVGSDVLFFSQDTINAYSSTDCHFDLVDP
jgi:hypothetical protein